MFKLATILALALCAYTVSSSPSISEGLLEKLKHGETATVIVYMKQNPITHLEQFKSARFASRTDRVKTIVGSLKTHAAQSQKEVLEALADGVRHGALKVHSLFTSNTVVVHNADYATVKTLMTLKGVAEIMEDGAVPVQVLASVAKVEKDVSPMATWGIAQINADKAWALGYKGKGIVVAQICTGVRYTHEALSGRWRADAGWLDPSGDSSTPVDSLGVGTHAIGTIVGAGPDSVGVAPEATWISCRGCSSASCSNADLLKCGDFINCPSGDCSNAPHIVNNIWGGSEPGNTWFDSVIVSWRNSGIIATFPANGGVTCGSIASPADNKDVFTAGVSTPSDEVSAGSGRGPAGQSIKPNVVAPAENTYSAWNSDDKSYNTVSGTTYASAHSAGVLALAREAAGVDEDVSVVDIINAVHKGAVKIVTTLEPCGGIPNDRHPNNVAGYGRLDALGAVEAARSLRRSTGFVF